jgi:hypothetical protein
MLRRGATDLHPAFGDLPGMLPVSFESVHVANCVRYGPMTVGGNPVLLLHLPFLSCALMEDVNKIWGRQ